MSGLTVGLNAVIVAVTDEEPRVLTLRRDGPRGEEHDALPYGPLDPVLDRTLELALRGWVREQTGLEVGYVEQLYTFGDRNRDPRERGGGPRVLSIGYLALVLEEAVRGAGARWSAWYSFLPWEDWRRGKPRVLEGRLEPALSAWIREARGGEARVRRERVEIAFGLSGAPWDLSRVLDRYELLWEAGLVREAHRDDPVPPVGEPGESEAGRPMIFDHRRILATALSRLRGKIQYRPVVFELLPPTFTLLQLQRVVEALSGIRLHKQNFRRFVEKGGLVEGTGRRDRAGAGRPAELFRFRREVLRERPAPGIGLPG